MFVADNVFLASPGFCFICEDSPPSAGRMVDTERNFMPLVQLPQSGRRYICENCVRGANEALGWNPQPGVSEELTVAQKELAGAKNELADKDQYIADLRNALADKAVAEAKPARKPRAPKAETV